MKLALVSYGDAKLTNETLEIIEAVLDEGGFPQDDAVYAHCTRKEHLAEIKGFDLIVTFGAEALKRFCKVDKGLRDYAGCMTWNEDLKTWILPTYHPNTIYQEKYNEFDFIHAHVKRAVDLLQGTLDFPEVGGPKINWEFIGHNGDGWDPADGYHPVVWSGYFEYTPEEVARQEEILDGWLADLDSIHPDVDEHFLYALDTESYNLNHFQPLTMIQVYEPFSANGKDKGTGYAFTWGVIAQAQEKWRRFLNHPKARFVLHNTKHDRKMLRQWLEVDLGDRDDDTMCWALGLTEKGNQTGLKYTARQYCNAPFWDEGLKEWLSSDKNQINYGHIRPDILAEYGCLDVYYTYQLRPILQKLVEREGTEVLVRDILVPAQRAFADIEFEGIRIDQAYAKQLAAKWQPLIDKAIIEVQEYAKSVGFPADPDVTKGQITREICSCVPVRLREDLASLRVASYGKYLRETHGLLAKCERCNSRRYIRGVDNTLNVRSSAQMAHLCHDMLKMVPTFEPRQCNKLFWDINADHEFTKLVVAYRELDYLQRNFVEGLQGFIFEDGRVHPDIFLAGTVSGRLSMKKPALQTVPSRSKNAKHVKRMFLPDEGDLLVNVDYKALEMFVTHHLTKDPQLIDDLLTKDIYKATAMDIFRKAYEEVTAEERTATKPVVLASGYNIKAGKLSKNPQVRAMTGGSKEAAQKMLDAFWNRYKVWDDVKESWKLQALTECVLTTEFGRKRRWTLVTADNRWKVENQASNFKSQSTGSDICLTRVILLTRLLKEHGYGRVLLTVHDSIVFSLHKETIHEAVALIEKTMTDIPLETDTPFFVDTGIGPDYAYACDENKGGYVKDRDYTTWNFQ